MRAWHGQRWGVKIPIDMHADMHVKNMAKVHQQGVNALIIGSIHQLFWMESQHKRYMAARLFALHNILVCFMAQRKALGQEDAPHRTMYGGAARRDLAYLTLRQAPSLSLVEQHQLLEYVVPNGGS